MYLRMLVTMLVGLYTSRLVLKTLGVADYGIYNVVGGFVLMFSLLTTSLSSSISRFLTFELGKKDIHNTQVVFSTSMSIQLSLCILILIIAETVGLWFLHEKMVIPPERMNAANWVFQFSILAFCMGLISVPYTAAIVAHEKMTAFAYFGIIEVIIKLGIVVLVSISSLDHLIFYAFLIAMLGICMQISYIVYCKRNFAECHYIFVLDKSLYRRMASFAGWTFLGNASYILMTHGMNILSNIFFGVLINAARSVAAIVDNVFSQFVNSFTISLNPAITKSYASGENDDFQKLMLSGSKYCFFLLYALMFPLILKTDFVLSIWLDTVPAYSIPFVRMTLINLLFVVTSTPLITGLLAKGQLREYQIALGSFSLLALPITYVIFKLYPDPRLAYVVVFFILLFQFIVRFYFIKKLLAIKIMVLTKRIVWPIIKLVAVSLPIGWLFYMYGGNGVSGSIISMMVSEVIVLTAVYFVGLSSNERSLAVNLIRSRLSQKS